MNRKSLFLEIAILVLTLSASALNPPEYQFAAVSNSVTAGATLNAVANNGNVFVCVGSQSTPVLSVNTNNFAEFAANNAGGGYLLFSNAWTNTLKSPIKSAWLNCVATQPGGFIASGASNTVLVSSDGVNWSNWGHVLAAGEQAYSVDGIAYNPFSGTFGAALAVYEASWTTNPISTNVWQIAGLQTESFAESFRGITSFASSNMALCGIFGDIRVSLDGGRNWRLSQQIDLKYPNLLSVASDGGSNLVCAGDYSMLEVSTNGGPNASSWNFQTNFNFGLSATLTNFNTVAYSAAIGQFLAAGAIGANGLIAMAPESPGRAQWTWTRQTNLWQYQDGVLAPMTGIPSALNGATVAASGFFQGIAMLVGDSGTVMIGGFSPLAPLNLSNTDVTNVLTNPPTNGVLAATVNWDLYHPIGVLTVDWYASSSGGTPVALNTLTYRPTNEICGTFTNWAQARDLRTGFVSANRTPFVFTIIPGAPSDPISATNCGDVNGQFGMCDTTPLSVTVVTNAANPAGAILVNWYDANSNLVAANVSPSDDGVVTYAPVVSPGIYAFYAQATNPATGLASTNWTALTYQENELPQWPASAEYFTNVLTAPFQTNPIMAAAAITNFSAITSIEPGAQIVVDWYTGPDPAVSTYGNPEAPVAFGGASTSGAIWGTPGGIVSGSGTLGNFIPTNRVCGVYTYYARARIVDPANATSCACQSTNLIPVTFVLLPPAPADAIVDLTNALTGIVQVNAPIWVDLLTNVDNPASNFAVNWYSAPGGSNNLAYLNNGTETNLNNRFFHTPTNAVCGVFTNWAETMALHTGSGSPVVSAYRIPVVFAIVPATPTALGMFDQTNCVEVPAQAFKVAVTNGQTADWYPTIGTVVSGPAVATGTLSFTPTNSSAGTWTFAAQAVDPVSGLSSTGSVLATLSLFNCTDSPAISFNSANGTGTIQWPGNLKLLSATNLTPPVVWSSVATGSMFLAPNTLTFTNTNPPTEFFRLTN